MTEARVWEDDRLIDSLAVMVETGQGKNETEIRVWELGAPEAKARKGEASKC